MERARRLGRCGPRARPGRAPPPHGRCRRPLARSPLMDAQGDLWGEEQAGRARPPEWRNGPPLAGGAEQLRVATW